MLWVSGKCIKKIGVQPDLNLRRQHLAAQLSQMVTAKPLGHLKSWRRGKLCNACTTQFKVRWYSVPANPVRSLGPHPRKFP